ncbi:uncharacterized protein A4U43_C06F9940 [Asparagus officinalis]|uniref:Uncharacterized protein n=1 Tax=Asparagus officinalis TaxID=4686 RepID=A0A5P1ERF4_ASPOF|nr:uncharacterized protein A4U43_C06F9940 [Asparagus officinalis]
MKNLLKQVLGFLPLISGKAAAVPPVVEALGSATDDDMLEEAPVAFLDRDELLEGVMSFVITESSIDGTLVRDSPNNPIAVEVEMRLTGDNEEDDITKARSTLQHHLLAVDKVYTILDVHRYAGRAKLGFVEGMSCKL